MQRQAISGAAATLVPVWTVPTGHKYELQSVQQQWNAGAGANFAGALVTIGGNTFWIHLENVVGAFTLDHSWSNVCLETGDQLWLYAQQGVFFGLVTWVDVDLR